MSDAAAVQRIGEWWGTLDLTTKSMFEQIFAEQPELAVRVLSGGSVVVPEATASLDDLFGGVEPFGVAVSPQYSVDLPVVDPEYPEVGTAFTVTYMVTNQGTDALADRSDAVRVIDINQNVIAEEPASGMALPKGGSESMQVAFGTGVPADGRYAVEVWVNLDGGAWGAPANEHGSQTQGATSLLVGAYESPAGPSTADQTFRQEASTLVTEAQLVQNLSYSAAEQLEPFRQFLSRAQTMVDAAVSDFPKWQAGPVFSAQLANYAASLGHVDPEYVTNWSRAEAEEAGVNLHQAALPFSTLPYDRDLLDGYTPALVESAGALSRCFR
ncbi:MAG: hypothetical protein ACRD0A_13815 [Acidimicrobiales bacterium]